MDGGRPQAPPPAQGEPGGHGLPPSSRIRRGTEIRSLLRRGKRRRTAHLDVFFAASPVSRSRWGVIVPKHRHTVVRRNLVRRRLREVGRTEVLPRLRSAGLSVDVIVRARREAYAAPFAVLRDELVEVTEALCSEPP